MYQQFDNLARLRHPMRELAEFSKDWLQHWRPFSDNPLLRKCLGMNEQVALLGFTHEREDFDIQAVIDATGVAHDVEHEHVWSTDFCHLLRFKKAHSQHEPRVLLVAPMSGHFATLLRGTIQALVQDHEVYVTDWINIRDVPPTAGDFDLDSYTEQLIVLLHGAWQPLGGRVPAHGVVFGGHCGDVSAKGSLCAHQPHLDGRPH
jgi:poly(3-hydroxybutyrate) depolymerase